MPIAPQDISTPLWEPRSRGENSQQAPTGVLSSPCGSPALGAKETRQANNNASTQDSPMCGIVGAIAKRNITPILIEGLRRLEYRGYDSAGVAVLATGNGIKRTRAVGKVIELENALEAAPIYGHLGIAHTRWATHGKPAERNAHPHLSERLAIVHNGIIENHSALRKKLTDLGYTFTSETDTEVVAHLLAHHYKEKPNLLCAFRSTLRELHGAYALGVIHQDEPNTLYCARMGSPLVIGEASEELFIASDPLALLQVTDQFIYLEEGDHARLTVESREIWNQRNESVEYPVLRYEHAAHSMDKGEYRHYMLKEIYEQPAAIANTLDGTLAEDHVLTAALGPEAETHLAEIRNIHIVACGTSYHAGLVARYWIEEQAGLPCQVEVASEYRYRTVAVPPNTLLITISQSGETADTLADLRYARNEGYLATLGICNVAGSTLVREADWRLLTHAGPEIGVASTKAFTTQLVALQWLTTALLQVRGKAPEQVARNVSALRSLPGVIGEALTLEPAITRLAERFANKHHALFLGRGPHYPIAMVGAL